MGRLVQKPWGGYTDYFRSNQCVFKIIRVNPGQRLSSQRHERRSEIWMCLSGNGEAIVGSETWQLRQGSKIDVPLGVVHRLLNTGISVLTIAETQYGHCDESDITRISDDYGRCAL